MLGPYSIRGKLLFPAPPSYFLHYFFGFLNDQSRKITFQIDYRFWLPEWPIWKVKKHSGKDAEATTYAVMLISISS